MGAKLLIALLGLGASKDVQSPRGAAVKVSLHTVYTHTHRIKGPVHTHLMRAESESRQHSRGGELGLQREL